MALARGILTKITQKSSIGRGAGILALLYFVSALLSLVREPLLAAKFGADNRLLDAYNMAFGLPDFIFNILILGAISAAFMPVFIRTRKAGRDAEAWRVANAVMNIAVVAMTAVSIVLFVFAPQILGVIAHGFRGHEATFLSGQNIGLLDLTAGLTRLMLISPILFAVSAIGGAVQLTFRRYLIFGLAPILYNLGIIFGLIFLVPRFDITGVAYGVIAGTFAQMVLHLVGLRKLGYRFRFTLKDSRGLAKIGRLMFFRSAALVTDRIEYLTALSIGTSLVAGVTIFGFAYRIQSVPVTIFGAALATAFFPQLAEDAARIDRLKFIQTLARGIRQVLFYIIPITFFMIMARREIATLILGFGKFGANPENIRVTASTLAIFSVSLFAQALLPILLRAYYALEDTKTPFFVAIFTMFVNITLALYFIRLIGAPGLALGFTMASLLDFLILSILLASRLGTSEERRVEVEVTKSILRIVSASLVMTAVATLTATYLETRSILSPAPFSRLTAYRDFFLVVLASGLSYLAAARLLRAPELTSLKNFFAWIPELTRRKSSKSS